MGKIIRLSEVNFETNLKIDDILKIVDMYIKEKGEPYEIKQNILYDTEETDITNGPVWYVDVILPETKKYFRMHMILWQSLTGTGDWHLL